MKKILIVFSHPAPYKVHFFNLLSKHVDLTVIFERTLSSYSKKQYQNNPPFLFKTIAIGGVNLGKENHFSFNLIRHLKKHTYDAIIMNGYSSLTEMVTIRYLIRHHIPYLLYVNGGVIRQENLLKKRIKKYLISHAKAWFSPSIHTDAYLLHYGANPHAIYHYPYATIYEHEILKTRPTDREKRDLRTKYQLPPTHLTISVGQFIRRKNFLQLIQFWKTLPPSFHLLIIGDGPLLGTYERYIKRHHLTHITLKPFQPKSALLELYKTSDVFILLSKEDIYGHVINEALSQGLPVLTTQQTISGKTLIDQSTGVLVDVFQPKTFKKAFESLLKQSSFASLERAKENTYEKMVEAHLEHFKELGLV